MTQNPFYPTGSDDTRPAAAQPRPQHAAQTPVQATTQSSTPTTTQSANPAVDLIRQKLERLYAAEPDAARELQLADTEPAGQGHSRHQRFMHELHASGKSLAEIQTAWHEYYGRLGDDEKRQVWEEFYAQSQKGRQNQQSMPEAPAQPRVPHSVYPTPTALQAPGSYRPESRHEAVDLSQHGQAAGGAGTAGPSERSDMDSRDDATIRRSLRDTLGTRAKLQPKHHVQSLVFGLGCGGLALLFVLFSFFNELVIAPFIQPSRTVAATPIIIGADGVAPSQKTEVIIPKINVQIPLVFDVKTIQEADVQKGLERGVVHYPTTAMPGQQGNAAFFGHSSNNIFNPGDYKFAFVLLHELVEGDTFYLTRDGTAYAYQVIDKKVIEPTEIGILDPIPGKTSTATLITCDPPGTTLRRLAVIGEQVSPDPSANIPGAPAPAREGSGDDFNLPGEAPSLWRRITGWIGG